MQQKPWYRKKRVIVPGAIAGIWIASSAIANTPPVVSPAAVELAPATETVPTNPKPPVTNSLQPPKKATAEVVPKPTPSKAPHAKTVAPASVPTAPQPPKPKTSNCDANYSGACVPIASDVDCAGGSGNGPAYVRGPVYIVGYDKYGLDRDGDGVACE